MAKPSTVKAKTPSKPPTQPGAQPATRSIVAPGSGFKLERVQRRERYLNLLVYGAYGVGKTTLAASATEVASMADVILINAEAGDLSLDEIEDLDAITVPNFQTLGRVNEYLKQHCKARDQGEEGIPFLRKSEAALRGVDESEIKVPKRYRTCIVDTLSEVEAYCMNQLLGISDMTRLDEEVMSAEWSEYKKNNSMMLRLVRRFRDLPMHVIFTCASSYSQDEQKRRMYAPDMTGKLASKVQGFMDMVGYYVIGKDGDKMIRRLYVSPNAKYDAKHRYVKFKGEYFTDPTIGKILEEVGLNDSEGAALT